MADLPSHAEVVIIGGGAVGCSVLYHLGKMGCTDAVLLEKNELTSGSSWHAAGNCPNFVGSWSMMKLQSYSTELYRRLGDEVDYPMNYNVTGAIRLAHSKERMDEFKHVCSMARAMGLDFEMMTNDEMQAVYPFLETHDLVGGCWDPLDGDIDPAQLTQAFAKGARNMGCKIIRFCPVTNVRREHDEWVVETEQGEIRCDKVVNAAGYRAAEVGRMFGRNIPCISLAHQYLMTDDIPELAEYGKKLPLLRDPDSSYYLRQEKHGLLLGPYEKGCKAHWVTKNDPMPDDFSFQLWPDDLERIEWHIEDACGRVPILANGGIKRVVNGPIPYAPDGNPLIGPMPGVPNAYEACVFTFGIVQAGGAGKIAAEWIVEGETEFDSWAVDPRRFTDHVTEDYALQTAIQIYSHEYAMHFPNMTWPAGREAKTSPTYPLLAAKGAEFGAYNGWERANWFPLIGDETGTATSYRRQHWFDRVKDEVRHVSDHVGVLELPGFSRFEVKGEGAADWLRTMITGNLVKPGRIGLVYFASPKGKVVTEMSLTRFSENHFWLLTGAGAYWHDRDWLVQNLPDDGSVTIEDVTTRWTAFVITGPKSRDVMNALSEQGFENDTFPWLTHQPIEIGMARGQAIRVSYAGELGWEVHVPMEYAYQTYQRILQAGADAKIRDFGMFALDSMRLEKGYRAWKGDLSSDYTMLESGLSRWVNFKKPDFIGKAALEAEAAEGSTTSFVTLIVEEAPGDEACEAMYLSSIFAKDERVGLVLSSGYGHRTARSIALVAIDTAYAEEGTRLEIEIFGARRKAIVAPDALYDPENERLKN